MPDMYYPSNDKRPCSIGLTSGHMLQVSGDRDKPTSVNMRFFKAAVEKGCLTVDQDPPSKETVSMEDRGRMIKAAMRDMLHSDDPNYFDGAGRPVMAVIRKKVNFSITPNERDRYWKEIEIEETGGEVQKAELRQQPEQAPVSHPAGPEAAIPAAPVPQSRKAQAGKQ